MFVEIFLKFLVGKIYVELFKTIHFKILKTKYIQNTDERKRSLAYNRNGLNITLKGLNESCSKGVNNV